MSVVDMYMDGVRLFVIVVHCHQEIAMLMDKQLDINYAANCDGLWHSIKVKRAEIAIGHDVSRPRNKT